MKNKKSHAANIANSDRLRKTLKALASGHQLTTRDIARQTGSMAVHTDIHELRENGFDILMSYEPPPCGGRQVPHYQLLGSPGESHG